MSSPKLNVVQVATVLQESNMAKAVTKVLSKAEFAGVMNKEFGVGTMRSLTDDEGAKISHWCSTGIYNMDDATGWGLPGGRVVEYFGAESSGKTTALMAAMVSNAERGGLNIVFDAESTFDQDRYVQMGGDPDSVIMIDTGTMEEFYDKLKKVTEWAGKQEMPHNAVVLIGVDSMPMIIPKRMFELEGDEQTVGEQARINSRHLPTINDLLCPNTCLVLLNQVRDKIGGMAWNADGNIDTPGGRIIKHLCSIRVIFNKAGMIDNGKSKDDRIIIGMKTQAKVVKNKVAPPLRKVTFNIMFDERGIDNVQVMLAQAVSKKWISKKAAGIFELENINKEVQFKAADFAEVLQKYPKWTKRMLGECFELEQGVPDLTRYIGKSLGKSESED
jgi:recombination protein RecA